jgi:hypothetical protein
MSKPKLLIAESTLGEPWLAPYWAEFFDYEIFNWARSYNANDGVALIDDRYDQDKYNHIKSQGLRVVRSYLMDSYVRDPCEYAGQDLILRAQDSIWIQESVMWKHWKYNTPRESTVPDKFFLLLINQLRPHRKTLLEAVDSYLPESLYTCVVRNILLPDDVYVPITGRPGTSNDRYYVPRWYSETCFSMVSETLGHSNRVTGDLLYISEKSFKPIAHSHPFVIQGTWGNLQYLQSRGFETFSHVIDESYDQEPLLKNRVKKILEILDSLYQEFKRTGTVFQDAKTKQILEHNYNLFFDSNKIRELFRDQIAHPIMEFIES